MDTVSSQPGDLTLPAIAEREEAARMPAAIAEEIFAAAKAELCGLGREQFVAVLSAVGARLNYGQLAGVQPDRSQQWAFLRGLHLADLALAQGCALGLDAAWQRFVDAHREPLTRAAIAIAGSTTEGHELVGSLYGDLFGLKEADGLRRSPLASYSGRGSLIGWLRTTLAQRHVDHHRRTRRETSLETPEGEIEIAAAVPEETNPHVAALGVAVARALATLDAEDRFVLATYFLDRRTLLEIARMLRVHEATISRRVKRLTGELRKELLGKLQSGGLSRRAAEEALGSDPRDVEINLRAILQSSESPAFPAKTRRET